MHFQYGVRRRFMRSVAAPLKAAGRVAVAATLCMLLVEQPLLAAAAVVKTPAPAPVPAPAAELPGQERVLHPLNRLTVGPRG